MTEDTDTDDSSTDIEQREDVEIDERVERFDRGVSITTEVKRGTGTRDQDKHILKSKGRTFDEARYYHEQGLDWLDGGGDGAPLDRVRRWSPDGDGDE